MGALQGVIQWKSLLMCDEYEFSKRVDAENT